MKKFIGIDYGSKLAGTTVICYAENNKLQIKQSEKKKDADVFIKTFCADYRPDYIYIDAPLSLPKVYSGNASSNDYFYRQADKETKAMSPMFLGGLTARAMKLNNELSANCYEAYPKMLVSTLQIESFYKLDLTAFLSALAQATQISLPESITNWHQVDGVLAYIIGMRHQRDEALTYGDPNEGVIYV